MKILYVSQYFSPEMGAPAARVDELSRHWAKAGHDVTVLTGFPNHPTGKVPQAYRKAFRRLVMKENIHGVKVVRTWLLPFPNRRSYERMLNYTSFCISAAFTGMFLSRPDVIIATSPQLLVGLSGWFLARVKHAPLVFEVRDLWPESLAAVGIGDKNSRLYRVLAAIARFLYREAQGIVVVSPAFKRHLVEHLNVPPSKIFTVQNGVETDIFAPLPATEEIKTKLGWENRLVISYIGTLGMAHGLESLLDAAARVEQKLPQALFVLIGEGAHKVQIIAAAKSRNLGNVCFLGEQPRDRIPGYVSASDVCLVLLKKSAIFKTVIPTKMLEFMACCRPIILGVEGQAREIVETAQAGFVVRPENVDDLAEAIVRLAKDRGLRENLGRNGRQYILQNFSRGHTAKVYLEILESLLLRNETAKIAA